MMDFLETGPERSQHLKGILLMTGAGLCWSTGGLFVRSVDITNSWEIAFWRSEESANPDTEVINAIRPGMSTIPNSLLLCICSPFARRGELWNAYRRYFGNESDSVLVEKNP